mmetsp:Transcript_3106/g.7163  ORF Transcript_3106/g.7163 Transcript_3106/m.7163 type:complete len:711 (-) Transcript_3106:35-2167(-)
MDLVDDEQAHQLRVRAVAGLARDDVPLLGSRHDHLRVLDLLAAHRHVSRQLAHVHSEGLEACAQVAHHLRHQRLHGSHVHNLKRREVQAPVGLAVEPQLVEDGKHRDVGLAGAGGRAQQHVLGGQQRGVVHLALDAVEGLHAGERGLGPLGQLLDGAQRLPVGKRLGLQRRDVHLLVPLLGAAVGPGGQLAALVGHEVGPRGERKGVQLQQLAPGGRRAAADGTADAASLGNVRGNFATQLPRLFADLRLHRALAHARGRALSGLLHGAEDGSGVGSHGHLRLDGGLLGVVLAAGEARAPDDAEAGAQQLLDEVKLVVVQQQHEAVLARALVVGLGGERHQHVVRHLAGLGGLGVGVAERGSELALEPVGVDVGGFDAGVTGILLAGVHVHALHLAPVRRLLAAALAVVVLVVDVAGLQHLVHLVVLVLLLLLPKLNSDADVVVQGVAGHALTALAAAAGREVGDELAYRHELRELLAGRRAHQLLHAHLAIGVVGVPVLQHGEHLLGGAPEHVLRLVAELPLDHAQEGFVRGARLARLGAVGAVRVGSHHAAAAAGAGALAAALGLKGVQIVLVLAPLALVVAALLGLFHLVLQLRGLGAMHAVAERLGVDFPPQRLRLAARLARDAILVVRGQHQARVRAVLILPEARVGLGAARGVVLLLVLLAPSAVRHFRRVLKSDRPKHADTRSDSHLKGAGGVCVLSRAVRRV